MITKKSKGFISLSVADVTSDDLLKIAEIMKRKHGLKLSRSQVITSLAIKYLSDNGALE